MLLFEAREGILGERLVSCPSGPTLPADVLGREERLARSPDRRRTNERGECIHWCISTVFELDDEKVPSRQRKPLEERNAYHVRVAATAKSDVAAIVHDEGCDALQTTLGSLRDRPLEIRNRHATDARSRCRRAQDALWDMSPAAVKLRALEAFAQERQNIVGLRIVPEHRLREHELPVEVDVEDATLAGHDLDRADLVLQLLENPHRQTGGVRQRASGNAVLDPDPVLGGHGYIQSVMPPVPCGRFTTSSHGGVVVNICPQRADFPCGHH